MGVDDELQNKRVILLYVGHGVRTWRTFGVWAINQILKTMVAMKNKELDLAESRGQKPQKRWYLQRGWKVRSVGEAERLNCEYKSFVFGGGNARVFSEQMTCEKGKHYIENMRAHIKDKKTDYYGIC